jgi:tetratricopeptide (TPR) repeat protein
MQSHLQNSENHGADMADNRAGSAASASSAQAAAEALKEQGNNKFKLKQYQDAIKLYSRAISTAAMPTYYNNRAACRFMLGEYQDCVLDCKAALKLDECFVKAHVRLSKALCELGEFQGAQDHLEHAKLKILQHAQPDSKQATYSHADGSEELVRILKEHSHDEGGGYSIFIPSLKKERQTVSDRLKDVHMKAGPKYNVAGAAHLGEEICRYMYKKDV